MTTTDPFTTPAEAEREARVEQAEALLADAARTNRFNTPYRWNDDHRQVLKEDDAPTAMYAAQAATAHALLAVRDELADIAESLRTLAATPSVVHRLADQARDSLAEVGGEIRELTATVNQGVEFADSTAAAVGSVVVGVHELTDAVDRLAEPRPRWWQRWLRRALREPIAQTDVDP